MNRIKGSQDVSIRTSTPAIGIPSKGGVWEAPSSLRDAEGKPLPARPGESLMLVRIEIKKSALNDAGKFTLSQLRLVCTPKGGSEHPLAGRGTGVHPIGFVGRGGRLEEKTLTEIITIQSADVPDNVKEIDFAFYVPSNMVPTLVQFKQNNVARVSAIVSGEDTPEALPFEGAAPTATPDERTPDTDTTPDDQEM